MKRSVITNLFTTFFLASAFFLASNVAQARDVEPPVIPSSDVMEVPTEAKGGPRGLIQERTSINITQPDSEFLEIVVNDQSGNIVHESTTTDRMTMISTESWSEGEYNVITIDLYGDRQDFQVIID